MADDVLAAWVRFATYLLVAALAFAFAVAGVFGIIAFSASDDLRPNDVVGWLIFGLVWLPLCVLVAAGGLAIAVEAARTGLKHYRAAKR